VIGFRKRRFFISAVKCEDAQDRIQSLGDGWIRYSQLSAHTAKVASV
jgi:hypothetical protein